MLINQKVNSQPQADRLSQVFMALADPTRRQMIERLSQSEATVKELAQPFSLSMPAISKHLKVLERAGLISRGRNAQWRPCRFEVKPLQEGMHWMNQYAQLWEEGLKNLGPYLERIQAAQQKGREPDNG